ncbi:hypothetical protein GCM10010923_05500 [Blastomonas marina]|uniref:CAAX prenyl protease 2/Lysostaphin resistance protein A-like domain-containing protein n=1 Tax=Blastomonas marina TaxID=1867408 RepID=A0ABQ1F638_9SPHN|nr:CPBP family intramembrane glutamic endopeptidase [Blastomonas marina]GFZ99949.1 hypothetical protein GCM10010923_05500 [Blastomonas marina]
MSIQSGRGRTLAIYFATIVLGYALFIAPNLYFGIFKPNSGLTGENMAWIGLFQLVTVTALVWGALRLLGTGFREIGWDWSHWKRDALLGAALGGAWALVEMLLVYPSQGGAEHPHIAEIIAQIGGRPEAMLGYLVLGVLGGGVTEEIFNRGFTINVLRTAFADRRVGLYVAASFSIVAFMVGHLPRDGFDWIVIFIPTLIYTVLFVRTGRLTAPILAHGVHNALVLAIVWFAYAG